MIPEAGGVDEVSDLRVVDLASQASAVRCHVRGWSKDEVLVWFRRHGTVKTPHPYDPDVYGFSTPSGLQTAFVLRQDGELLLFGDHTIYRPRD